MLLGVFFSQCFAILFHFFPILADNLTQRFKRKKGKKEKKNTESDVSVKCDALNVILVKRRVSQRQEKCLAIVVEPDVGNRVVDVLLLVRVQPGRGSDQVLKVEKSCFVSFTIKVSVEKLDKTDVCLS